MKTLFWRMAELSTVQQIVEEKCFPCFAGGIVLYFMSQQPSSSPKLTMVNLVANDGRVSTENLALAGFLPAPS